MKKRLVIIIAMLVIVSTVAVAPASAKPNKVAKPKLTVWQVYRADLDPLNQSGVDGVAYIYRHGNTFKVHVDADGLEPGMVHPQHVHGFSEPTMDAVCPPQSAAGADGILTLEEGLPYYGPVLLPLDLPDGSFPVATAGGEVHYTRMFYKTQMLNPLQKRVIVLHGMTVGGEYVPTLPVACGELERVGNVKTLDGTAKR